MPTPMPIMMASTGEVSGTSVKPDMMPSPAMPMATPMRAVAMGTPAAMTEPNATSRTMRATIRPMPSWPSTSLAAQAMSPDTSACTPASRAGSMASTTAS